MAWPNASNRPGSANAAWSAGDRGAALREAAAIGAAHWGRACDEILALHRTRGAAAAEHIDAYVGAPERTLR